jgi:hypothetical protein
MREKSLVPAALHGQPVAHEIEINLEGGTNYRARLPRTFGEEGRHTVNRDRAIAISVLLLRVVAGLIFMQAGGMKILDWFGGIPAAHGGHPKLMSQIWIA